MYKTKIDATDKTKITKNKSKAEYLKCWRMKWYEKKRRKRNEKKSEII